MQTERNSARKINDLTPEEKTANLKVVAWRVWTESIFVEEDYKNNLEIARTNPQSIIVTLENASAHDLIDKKLHGVVLPFKYGSLDLPNYILEPLNEKQFNALREQTQDLLSSEDFKTIF